MGGTSTYSWQRTAEELAVIAAAIQEELVNEYRLPKSPIKENKGQPTEQESHLHFENGHFLHSTQYYFAKRFFQNTRNCDDLAILMANKLLEEKLENVTLIGFRSYTGLVLNKTKELLNGTRYKIDYAILEPFEDRFTWQSVPDFSKINTNFLIVLPITCTCSTYIRIRKFLQNQISGSLISNFPVGNRKAKEEWIVRRKFINVFLIQDYCLESVNDSDYPLYINHGRDNNPINNGEKNRAEKISELYSNFNWDKIEKQSIHFKNERHDENEYIALPLVKLFSNLFLPEKCEYCFPSYNLVKERSIFLTHDNYETPNLLIDFPKFGQQREITEDQLLPHHIAHVKEGKQLFTNLFPTGNTPSHHYGHLEVNNSSYLHFIRGNIFYAQNKTAILDFYNNILKDIFTLPGTPIKNIVFITSDTKHNSSFLDDISSRFVQGIGKENRPVCTILRFEYSNEFIDNFMVNYKKLFDSDETIIIYFEEVFSAGKTFKLLSNYIKHYTTEAGFDTILVHGFDYVFTLIDRTPFYTREEIEKKLYSRKNPKTQGRFIPFFKLNVPIVSSAHLGDPLKDGITVINKMISNSHLDVVKKRIGNELEFKKAKKLESIVSKGEQVLNYFPFEDDEGNITFESFDEHKEVLRNGNLDLLKLYLAHEINTILVSGNKPDDPSVQLWLDKENLVDSIITWVINTLEQNEETFFVSRNTINKRKNIFPNKYKLNKQERAIIEDSILKLLSRHPFTYYNQVYESVFKYCLTQIETVRKEIVSGSIPSFRQIRQLKFFLRRLVDLDSSYLVSKEMIKLIKFLYEFQPKDGKNKIQLLLDVIENKITTETTSGLAKRWAELVRIVTSTAFDIKAQTPVDGQQLVTVRQYIDRLISLNQASIITEHEKTLLVTHYQFKLPDSYTIEQIQAEINSLIKSHFKNNDNKLYFIEETILNNLAYKYNSINSLSGLMFYCYKESVFKSHYRSIKLEAVINDSDSLPEVVVAKGDITMQQVKDYYYQTTGMIKAENIYLIDRLKELHKAKLPTYEKHNAAIDTEIEILKKRVVAEKSESKSLELLETIQDMEKRKFDFNDPKAVFRHYFVELKSDPVIINANKFLNKSRYSHTNKKLNEVKLAVANMMIAATNLNEPSKEVSNGAISFLDEIKRKLKSIVDILQPGIESELGYALCMKYSNKASIYNPSENIYVISSDLNTDESKISEKGLIFNLLSGLYASKKLLFENESDNFTNSFSAIAEQSLLASVDEVGKWSSFSEEYYIIPDNKMYVDNNLDAKASVNQVLFKDLFQHDRFSYSNEVGLPLLDNCKMILLFRLSEVNTEEPADNSCNLEGKAVLVITCSETFTRENYLDFVSNEKVRLLLLIKEELLKYLKQITDSSTFHELIQNKEQTKNLAQYQRALKHGLDNYFSYQTEIMDTYVVTEEDMDILDTINLAIRGQVNAHDIKNNIKNKIYKVNEVLRRLKNILTSEKIEGKKVYEDEYIIENNTGNDIIYFDSFIMEVVLTELVINAKRHSPFLAPDIKILIEQNAITIRNLKIANNVESVSTEKFRKGLILCNQICDKLRNYRINDNRGDKGNLHFEIKIEKED